MPGLGYRHVPQDPDYLQCLVYIEQRLNRRNGPRSKLTLVNELMSTFKNIINTRYRGVPGVRAEEQPYPFMINYSMLEYLDYQVELCEGQPEERGRGLFFWETKLDVIHAVEDHLEQEKTKLKQQIRDERQAEEQELPPLRRQPIPPGATIHSVEIPPDAEVIDVDEDAEEPYYEDTVGIRGTTPPVAPARIVVQDMVVRGLCQVFVI